MWHSSQITHTSDGTPNRRAVKRAIRLQGRVSQESPAVAPHIEHVPVFGRNSDTGEPIFINADVLTEFDSQTET